jgi:hypothetical protein
MKDQNGIELKTKQIVLIENGFFKADNGLYIITHSPGDSDWLGNAYCLNKVNSNFQESKTKYSTAFWPLMVTTNSRDKRITAKQHNAKFATIEVVKE